MRTTWYFWVAVALVGFVPAAAAQPETATGRNLELYFIDVMGGAATLVVTPEKESILIDSGWPGQEDRDPRRIVHALKDLAGCGHLDYVVTTHWHVDHFGGVAGLSRLVEIKQFLDRGLPEDQNPSTDFPEGPSEDDPLGTAYRKASQGKRKALRAGDTIPLKGAARAVVLAAGGKVIAAPSAATVNPRCADPVSSHPNDPSDNARSVTIRLSFGKFDFLDCGDLTWNVERELVCPTDRIGPIDLYQVTHHGMDISNNPILVQTIAPTVTIMNNGPRKGGAPATVALLKSISSIQAAYQLHRNVTSKPEENTDPALIANHDAEGGQLIHVSVVPDGSKFSVQLGESGAKREFSSR